MDNKRYLNIGQALSLDLLDLFGNNSGGSSGTSTISISAGLVQSPVIINNGDGTIDLLSCTANLFDNDSYSGDVKLYNIDAITSESIDEDVLTYITVDYNGGSPVYFLSDDASFINESDVIPVITLIRSGNEIAYITWKGLGSGLSNKLHQRFVKTDRFGYESGLMLSEQNTREIFITNGLTWYGAVRNGHSSFDSSTDKLVHWYPDSGNWEKTIVTQFPNNQYNDGDDLQPLIGNKFTTVNVYKSESINVNTAGFILGGMYDSVAEAEVSPIPEVPTNITNLSVFVGRFTIQNGNTNSSTVLSAFDTIFNGTAATNHTNLSNLSSDDHPQYVINDSSRGEQEVLNSLKIGDVTGGNYTQIESDGTIITRGDGTVWDDLVGTLIARRLTSTAGRLDYNYDENTITMQDNGDPNKSADRLIFNYQHPHSAVQTNVIEGTQAVQRLHIHWEQTSTDRIVWQVEYRCQLNGEPKNTTWTTVHANSVDNSVFPYVTGTLNQITNLVEVLIPENSLSATIQYRLTRIDSTGNDIEATFIDAHIKLDSVGSRREFIK